MENFQFRLLTYRLEAEIFLREVAPDVLTIVPWCGSLQNMFVSLSLSHTHTHTHTHTHARARAHESITLMALHENFFCHTPGLTQVTPQLHLRPG